MPIVIPEGRIEVRFRHERHDWLRMRIRVQADRPVFVRRVGAPAPGRRARRSLSLRISSVYCPFPALIAWLEAIASGVRECAMEWDAEGPVGRLEWDWPDLLVQGSERGQTRVLEIRGEERHVVAAFYQAFRGFAESSEYEPIRYEEQPLGERLVSLMKGEFNQEELIGQLLEKERDAAEARLCAIWGGGLPRCYPEDPQWIEPGWRCWDTSRRRGYLKELFTLPGGRGSESNLRALRSRRIERWLQDRVRPSGESA